MIYSSNDGKKVLVETEDVRKVSDLVTEICYFKGYLSALLLYDKLDDYSIVDMSKRCIKDIKKYKKLPEGVKVISNFHLLNLEKACNILINESDIEQIKNKIAI